MITPASRFVSTPEDEKFWLLTTTVCESTTKPLLCTLGCGWPEDPRAHLQTGIGIATAVALWSAALRRLWRGGYARFYELD
jgi:hypothetical protein